MWGGGGGGAMDFTRVRYEFHSDKIGKVTYISHEKPTPIFGHQHVEKCTN